MNHRDFAKTRVIIPICAALIVYAIFIDIAVDYVSKGQSPHPFIQFFLFEFLTNKYIKDFLFGLSFAIIIAKIVAVTVERSSRSEQKKVNAEFINSQELFFREKTEAISKSVFEGIYGIGFAPDYIDEVVKTVFGSALYRKDYHAIYRLKNCSDSTGLILNVFVSYTVVNNSRVDEIVKPMLLLDAIKTTEYIENTKPIFYKIGGVDKLTNADIDDFSSQLKYSTNNKAQLKIQPITLNPSEDATIEICYEVFKEISDNEVHQLVVPSSGFNLEIINETNIKLILGANSIHRTELLLKNTGSSTVINEKRWTLPCPTLPFHGYILYWIRE